jgi:hypothetical protein
MADEKKSTQSVIGDVTQAINDAWQFFLPETIRAFVATAIIAFLGGTSALRAEMHWLSTELASIDVRGAAEVLDKYKLTPLMPIVTLFVLAALAYSFRMVVFSIASLIPMQFSYSEVTLILGKKNGAAVWYRLPYVESPVGLIQAMELEQVKGSIGESKVLYQSVDSWRKRTSELLQQVETAKFFAVWTVAWTVFFSCAHGIPSGIFIRTLIVLVWIGVWASVSLLRAVDSVDQTASAKVLAALAHLTAQGRSELPITEDKKASINRFVEMCSKQGWWWVSIGSMRWIGMLREIDRSQVLISALWNKWSKMR